MVSARAVDEMLVEKGLDIGTLKERIDAAAQNGLITPEMARWAHNIRLDANDQRHAERRAPPPSSEDAERCYDFAKTLAEILFVIPDRVTRGVKASTGVIKATLEGVSAELTGSFIPPGGE